MDEGGARGDGRGELGTSRGKGRVMKRVCTLERAEEVEVVMVGRAGRSFSVWKSAEQTDAFNRRVKGASVAFGRQMELKGEQNKLTPNPTARMDSLETTDDEHAEHERRRGEDEGERGEEGEKAESVTPEVS